MMVDQEVGEVQVSMVCDMAKVGTWHAHNMQANDAYSTRVYLSGNMSAPQALSLIHI